jgi:hypothetical protein
MVAANIESPFATLLKQHAVEVNAATEARVTPKRAMSSGSSSATGPLASGVKVCSITGCGQPTTGCTALCLPHTLSESAQSRDAGTPRARARPSALVLDDSFMPALFGSITPTSSPRNLLTNSPGLSPSAEVAPRGSQPQRYLSSKFKIRRCTTPGCTKLTQGNTPHCKAHGGGRRCQEVGCTRAARGSTSHCISHGGGKRCSEDGCDKSAVGSTLQCVKHGGGRRCTYSDCVKSARGGKLQCARHLTLERKRQGLTSRAPPSAALLLSGAERRASVDALALQQQQPTQTPQSQLPQQQPPQPHGLEVESHPRRREPEGLTALNRLASGSASPAYDRFGSQPVGFSPRHALLSPAPSPTNSSSMFASLAQTFFGDNGPYGAPTNAQAGGSAQHHGATYGQGRLGSAHGRGDVHEPLEYEPDQYHGHTMMVYDEQQEHEHRRLLVQLFRIQHPNQHAHEKPAHVAKRARA